jgi:hypothetical protein
MRKRVNDDEPRLPLRHRPRWVVLMLLWIATAFVLGTCVYGAWPHHHCYGTLPPDCTAADAEYGCTYKDSDPATGECK